MDLYEDSDVHVFIGDIWHYLLKSLDPQNINGTYEKYRQSPAWQRKQGAVIQRDGCQCICGAQATEVHHKNYDNIGKEPLSDLVALCRECHENTHLPRVPPNPQQAVKDAFIAYIKRESDILQYADFRLGGNPNFVGYESGYQMKKGFHEIWISAWIPDSLNRIAAVIAVRSDSNYFESHYKKLKDHKNSIKKAFLFETLNPGDANNIFQLRVEKENVDLTQTANWDTAFRWLCQNLEKLYYVLRVHDEIGWEGRNRHND